jgi:hypothetical protein
MRCGVGLHRAAEETAPSLRTSERERERGERERCFLWQVCPLIAFLLLVGAVTFLVRELELLEPGKKFDMPGIDAAKHKAVMLFEAMRQAGLLQPSRKWSNLLAGNARSVFVCVFVCVCDSAHLSRLVVARVYNLLAVDQMSHAVHCIDSPFLSHLYSGTLRSGMLTKAAQIKPDDTSVWCVSEEELEVYGATVKFKV